MSIKRGIVYLRISRERQSNFSIDGQKMHTASWCERNNVEIMDTFIDEGYSARNFDRPDFQRLDTFIKKYYRTVDYLVVNSFDRFSRDAGEAIVAIKKLQRQFAIKVVSVAEGVTFDADDPGSFFYAGLMLLKGEDEIIRNRSRINLGIYTAKKKEGRYLGAAPFGYKNVKDERGKPIITPDEDRAPIIRHIYTAFLQGVPMHVIYDQAQKMGLTHTGNSCIAKILACHAYGGLIHVHAYKEYPEEIVDSMHEALVDRITWLAAQSKLKRREHPIRILNDELPLRGVLLCHCGHPLTGAASTGRHGRKFYYYKCDKVSAHNNISAKKVHAQLAEIWKYLSIPASALRSVRSQCESILEKKLETSRKASDKNRTALEKIEEQIHSLESKWVGNQMTFDTYDRWHRELTTQKMALKAQLEGLEGKESELFKLLQTQLVKLTDLNALYQEATILQKQQLVWLGFERQLYYQDGVARTPSVLPIFYHNELILREKKLLYIEKKRDFLAKIPSGGGEGNRTPVQTQPTKAFYMLIPALIVGRRPGPDKPTSSLAVWS
jgi:site-specific DNA recombinase